MRWDAAEPEAVLERIWDLHDRLSDAILASSRAHLLLPPPPPPPTAPPAGGARLRGGGGGGRDGCVFVKGGGGCGAAAEAVAEARSLHAIRSALEDLEDHLQFLHTVQSQQRAERDAAIARLEQSRLVLAMRLAEHQGKRYRVIDEALALVGEVSDKSRFISPEDVCATHSEDDAEDNRGSSSRIMPSMLSCSLSLAKNSFRLDKIGGALGNAAVFALHQIAFGSKTPSMGYRKRIEYSFQSGSSQQNGKEKHLEVYLARG
ncbi:plastid division protein PDV1 [Panicum miliaceum]|uniref:Plastid division protein PDV1 n=1 Tax=Panicum miliaceum TaxID=4540 RepID=A0A3L6RRF4_PANMI|nr:plastid division protein PDV1 [Panicum miliaceum]